MSSKQNQGYTEETPVITSAIANTCFSCGVDPGRTIELEVDNAKLREAAQAYMDRLAELNEPRLCN
jgi:hypothetical protein